MKAYIWDKVLGGSVEELGDPKSSLPLRVPTGAIPSAPSPRPHGVELWGWDPQAKRVRQGGGRGQGFDAACTN